MSAYNHEPFKAAKKSAYSKRLSPYEFAAAILTVAQNSTDGRASYTDLWVHLRGNDPTYPSFFRQFSRPFSELGQACVALKLPYINALIVTKGSRKPSKAAVTNMADFIKAQGIPTGNNAREYLEEQAKLAAALTIKELASKFGHISK